MDVMTTPVLTASVPCEDVLRSQVTDGRLTLYRVLLDVYAPVFPTTFSMLMVVNIWRGGHGEFTDRTRILTPTGKVAAEAEGKFMARSGGSHRQVYAFPDLWLPEAGDYAVEVYRNDKLMLTYTIVAVDTSDDVEQEEEV